MKRTAFILFLLCVVLTVMAVACTSVPEGAETMSATVTDTESGSHDPAAGSTEEPSESLPEETTSAETEPSESLTEATTSAETEPETTVEPNVISVTEGDVRVVVYSESLVRVEVSENGEFEPDGSPHGIVLF